MLPCPAVPAPLDAHPALFAVILTNVVVAVLLEKMVDDSPELDEEEEEEEQEEVKHPSGV